MSPNEIIEAPNSQEYHYRVVDHYFLDEKNDCPQERIHLLVIPDGNRRAKKGYTAAGRKVAEVAEYIALNHPEVGILTAWVFSEDNIEKRGNSDNFFDEISSAFKALGVDILTRNRLTSKNIRLQISGDISLLENKGGSAAELAATMKVVSSLTDKVANPSLILNIGVGNNLGNPHISLRTKSELDSKLARNSGIRTEGVIPIYNEVGEILGKGIIVYSNGDYWTTARIDDISNCILDACENILGRRVIKRKGFELSELIDFVWNQNHVASSSQKVSIDISYNPNQGSIDSFEDEMQLPGVNESLQNLGKKIIFHHPDGNTWTYGEYDATRTYHFYPYGATHQQQKCNGYIIPHQGMGAVVAADTYSPAESNGYTNLFLSRKASGDHAAINIEDIDRSISEAQAFTETYKPLFGATREMPELNLGVYDIGYFDELSAYMEKFPKDTIDTIVKRYEKEKELKEFLVESEERPERSERERYFLLKDFMVAKMLDWAKEIGYSFKNNGDFNAFVSYVTMSFYIYCYPEDMLVDYPELRDSWVIWVFLSAIYMVTVGDMDYDVFDKVLLEAKEKNIFILEAVQAFTAAIQRSRESAEMSMPETSFPEIQVLSNAFNYIAREYDARGADLCFNQWRLDMEDLFRTHKQEWDPSVTKNPLIEAVARGDSDEFRQKYLSKKTPKYFRSVIEDALSKYQGGDMAQLRNLRLYAYLCDIEQSIGAGLTFVSATCFETKNNPPDIKQLQKVKEISFLFNIYFRIANDLAEAFRPANDRECNVDTVAILTEGYKLELSGVGSRETGILASLYATSDLRNLMDDFEEVIFKEIENFQNENKHNPVWYRIALGMERGIRIGRAFYDETHPRTAGNEVAEDILNRLLDEDASPKISIFKKTKDTRTQAMSLSKRQKRTVAI